MRVYEGQEIECFYDRNSRAAFCDLEFRRCTFVSCAVSMTVSPSLRSTARNIRFIDCEECGCALHAAIVEDVLIDGLKTADVLQTWGAVFKHVVLTGKIGQVMLSDVVKMGVAPPGVTRAFREANRAYYESVDWALDISQAEFVDCDIRGLPGHLIRRDPETQVLIKRSKALKGHWRELPLEETHWPVAIQSAIDDEDTSFVLVAAKRAADFKELLAGLQLLRREGIAEPD